MLHICGQAYLFAVRTLCIEFVVQHLTCDATCWQNTRSQVSARDKDGICIHSRHRRVVHFRVPALIVGCLRTTYTCRRSWQRNVRDDAVACTANTRILFLLSFWSFWTSFQSRRRALGKYSLQATCQFGRPAITMANAASLA